MAFLHSLKKDSTSGDQLEFKATTMHRKNIRFCSKTKLK